MSIRCCPKKETTTVRTLQQTNVVANLATTTLEAAYRQPGARCKTTMGPISQRKHGPNSRPPRFAHINHPVRRRHLPLAPRSYVRISRPSRFPPDNRPSTCAVRSSHVVPRNDCVMKTRAWLGCRFCCLDLHGTSHKHHAATSTHHRFYGLIMI